MGRCSRSETCGWTCSDRTGTPLTGVHVKPGGLRRSWFSGEVIPRSTAPSRGRNRKSIPRREAAASGVRPGPGTLAAQGPKPAFGLAKSPPKSTNSPTPIRPAHPFVQLHGFLPKRAPPSKGKVVLTNPHQDMKPKFIPRLAVLATAALITQASAFGQAGAPVEIPGLLKMEVWNALSTTDNSIDNTLIADPRYPGSPTSVSYSIGFNSRTVYPDDSHEGYGGRISGLIIPPTTGAYRFFIYSDDSSRLSLSTDDKAANAVQIAEETGCCNVFTEPDQGTTRTSEPVNLVAGRKYYIEGIWKEGGGGD